MEPADLIVLILLGLNLAQAVVTWVLGGSLNKSQREAVRERRHNESVQKDLIDRLMHQSGSTWTPPPRVEREAPTEDVDPDWRAI